MPLYRSSIWLSLSLLIVPSVWADDSGISSGSGISPQQVQTVQTVDGATVCNAPILEVTNATLTDNSSTGKCTVTTGAGGGSGDITSVGDVVTGAAFDGTQGTTLTFFNAGGNDTLDWNGTDFTLGNDLILSDTDPFLDWSPTSGTKYEAYAHGSQWYLTDKTNGTILLNFDPQNNFIFRGRGTTYRWPTVDGTNGQFVSTNGSGTLTFATGSGGNSFETIAVPAGASVVADSSTDTLTITETSFLTITGTAATDTIDITQVTTDLGTDGLIAANAVALGTDTTNAYVTDLTAGTAIDVTGGGAETATITVDFDSTEVEATTWGAGGNASNIWTFNLSGTDPTLTAGSALITIGGALTSTGTITGVAGVFSGAVAANAGITFDGVGDTVGAHTMTAGTVMPTGTAPVVDAAGEFGEDTTDSIPQLIYGNGNIVSARVSKDFHVGNVVAADDNVTIWTAPTNVTVVGVACRYDGTGSTVATFTLEDASGNAMTITGTNPTCVTTTTSATFAAVTAANQLGTGEGLRFDTTNTPSPTTDDYVIDIQYTIDRQ